MTVEQELNIDIINTSRKDFYFTHHTLICKRQSFRSVVAVLRKLTIRFESVFQNSHRDTCIFAVYETISSCKLINKSKNEQNARLLVARASVAAVAEEADASRADAGRPGPVTLAADGPALLDRLLQVVGLHQRPQPRPPSASDSAG